MKEIYFDDCKLPEIQRQWENCIFSWLFSFYLMNDVCLLYEERSLTASDIYEIMEI